MFWASSLYCLTQKIQEQVSHTSDAVCSDQSYKYVSSLINCISSPLSNGKWSIRVELWPDKWLRRYTDHMRKRPLWTNMIKRLVFIHCALTSISRRLIESATSRRHLQNLTMDTWLYYTKQDTQYVPSIEQQDPKDGQNRSILSNVAK